MISYWEKDSFTDYDYAIVGGGIVGLSTAISLRERSPKARIVVIERGLRPTGASTKNAGFACFGSLSELVEDVKQLGEDGMLEMVELRWKGLLKLLDRIGAEKLRYHNYGGYELIRKRELNYLESLEHINELLYPIFKKNVFKNATDSLPDTGMNQKKIKALLYNSFEGQLHAGEMMRNLWQMAAARGIEILTGAKVKRIEDHGSSVRLKVQGQMGSDKIEIRASRVAVCTNGFTRKFFPEIKLEPGRGQVITNKPIPDLKSRGTYHMDRGFYYFRNVENRILFGGGRNLQMKEETTTEFGQNDIIIDTLKGYLEHIILPGTPVKIDQKWSGIMAFGNNKRPIIKQHLPNIFLGVRLGGMGVAIGSLVGEKLSEMMTGKVTV